MSKLRDRREPGHFWADNEIIDVFGDELGQNGISVYMTMTRFCYGVEVRLSLREIAAAARMSKDTVARSMKVLVALGLVIETKGMRTKTVSTWSLANVKALVQDYVKQSVSRTVSQGDRLPTLQMHETPNPGAASTLVALLKEQRENCLTVRQMDAEPISCDKKISLAHSETDLSQKDPGFETDLSHQTGPLIYKTQDTRLQNKNNNPLPPSQANGVQDASGSQSQRQEQSEAEIAGIAEACLGEMVREWNLGFEGVLKLLHQALFDTSLNLGNRRPKHLADGAEEWYRCFDSVVVVGCEPHAGSKIPRLIVASKNPAATEGGLKKYHLRIAKGMQQYFGQVVQVRVHSEARRL